MWGNTRKATSPVNIHTMNFIYKKILKLRERYIDTLAKLYEYSTAIYADNKLSVMLDSDMG